MRTQHHARTTGNVRTNPTKQRCAKKNDAIDSGGRGKVLTTAIASANEESGHPAAD